MPIDIASLNARIGGDTSDLDRKLPKVDAALKATADTAVNSSKRAATAVETLARTSSVATAELGKLSRSFMASGADIEGIYRNAFRRSEANANIAFANIERRATQATERIAKTAAAVPASFNLGGIPAQLQQVELAAGAAERKVSQLAARLAETKMLGVGTSTGAAGVNRALAAGRATSAEVSTAQTAATAVSVAPSVESAAAVADLGKTTTAAAGEANALADAFTAAGAKITAAMAGATAGIQGLAKTAGTVATEVAEYADGISGKAVASAEGAAGAMGAATRAGAEEIVKAEKTIALGAGQAQGVLLQDTDKLVVATQSRFRNMAVNVTQSWNNMWSVLTGNAAIGFATVATQAEKANEELIASYAQAEGLSEVDAKILLNSEAVITAQEAVAEATTKATEKIEMMKEVVEQATETFERLSELSLALTAIAGEAAHLSVEFDEMFTHLMNNTNLTDEQIEKVKASVISMSSTTGQSLDELSGAYNNILQQNYSVADSQKILNEINKDAVSTGNDLTKETNSIVNVMQAYGTSVGDSAKMVGFMRQVAIDTGQGIDQLDDSMKRILPVASTLHIPIAQVGAAMSQAFTAGQDPTQAGRRFVQLAEMIANPTAQIKGHIADIKAAFGVDLMPDFSLQALRAKGLLGIMQDVYKAAHGNMDVMNTVFPGAKGGVEAQLLAAGGGKGFADETKRLQASWDSDGKDTNARYARSMAGPGQQTAAATKAIANAFIPIGDQMAHMFLSALPNIMAFMHGLIAVLEVMAKLPPQLQVLFISFSAFKLLNFALGPVFGEFGEKIAEAVKALVGASGLQFNIAKFAGIRKETQEAAAANKGLAASAHEAAGGEAALTAAQDTETAAATKAVGATDALKAAQVAQGVSAKEAAASTALVGEAAAGTEAVAATGFVEKLGMSFGNLGKLAAGIGPAIAGGLAGAGEALSTIAAAFLPVIAVVAVVAGIGFLIYKAWTTDFGHIQERVDQFTGYIGPRLVNAWEAIKTDAVAVWGKIEPFIATVWDGIKATTSAAFSALKQSATGFVAFYLILQDVWNSVRKYWDASCKFVSGLWHDVVLTIQATNAEWAQTFQRAHDAIAGTFDKVGAKFTWLGNIWKTVVQTIQATNAEWTQSFQKAGEYISNLPFFKYLAGKNAQASGIVNGAVNNAVAGFGTGVMGGPFGGQIHSAYMADKQAPNLSENLISAVIKAESSYNPNIGKAGDPGSTAADIRNPHKGLMQLSPELMKQFGVTNPFDPQQNIDAGSKYLGSLLTKYQGDIGKALAAYNMGPGAFKKIDEELDRAPRETRDYVDKIMSQLGRMNQNFPRAGMGAGDYTVNTETPKFEELMLQNAQKGIHPIVDVNGKEIAVQCGQAISNALHETGFTSASVSNLAKAAAGNPSLQLHSTGRDTAGNPAYPEGTIIYFGPRGNIGNNKNEHFAVAHMMGNGTQGLVENSQAGGGGYHYQADRTLESVMREYKGQMLAFAPPGMATGTGGPPDQPNPGGDPSAMAKLAKATAAIAAQKAALKKKAEAAKALHVRALKEIDDMNKAVADAVDNSIDLGLGKDATKTADAVNDKIKYGDLKGIAASTRDKISGMAQGVDALNVLSKVFDTFSGKLKTLATARTIPVNATELQKTKAEQDAMFAQIGQLDLDDAPKNIVELFRKQLKSLKDAAAAILTGQRQEQVRKLVEPMRDQEYLLSKTPQQRAMIGAAGGPNAWRDLGEQQAVFSKDYNQLQGDTASAAVMDSIRTMTTEMSLAGNTAEKAAIQAAGGAEKWKALSDAHNVLAMNAARTVASENLAVQSLAEQSHTLDNSIADAGPKVATGLNTAIESIRSLLRTDGAAANDPIIKGWIDKIVASAKALDLKTARQQIKDLNTELDDTAAANAAHINGTFSARSQAWADYVQAHKSDIQSQQAALAENGKDPNAYLSGLKNKVLGNYDSGEAAKTVDDLTAKLRTQQQTLALMRETNPIQAYIDSAKTWDADSQSFKLPGDSAQTKELLTQNYLLEQQAERVKTLAEGFSGLFMDALSKTNKNFSNFFANIFSGFQTLLYRMATEQLQKRVTAGLQNAIAGIFDKNVKKPTDGIKKPQTADAAASSVFKGMQTPLQANTKSITDLHDLMNNKVMPEGFVPLIQALQDMTVALGGSVTGGAAGATPPAAKSSGGGIFGSLGSIGGLLGLIPGMSGIGSVLSSAGSIGGTIAGDVGTIQGATSAGSSGAGGFTFDPTNGAGAGIYTDASIPVPEGVTGRAIGGAMFQGESYIVGEHGPEVVKAQGDMNVTANDGIGDNSDNNNGMIVHQHFNISTPNVASFQSSQTQIAARAHTEATQAAQRNNRRNSR